MPNKDVQKQPFYASLGHATQQKLLSSPWLCAFQADVGKGPPSPETPVLYPSIHPSIHMYIYIYIYI